MNTIVLILKGVVFQVCYVGNTDEARITSILLDGVEVEHIIADDWRQLILEELLSHLNDRARRLKYSHDDCF